MAKVAKFELGARVTTGAGDKSKSGVVAFVGETEFAAGEWIGIVLDAPDGKNDGSVAGVKYFECEPNFGLFVKAAQVRLATAAPSAPPAAGEQPAQAAAPPVHAVPILQTQQPPPAAAAAAEAQTMVMSPQGSAEKDTREKLAALREKRKARESSGAGAGAGAEAGPVFSPASQSDTLVPTSKHEDSLAGEVLLLRAKVAELSHVIDQQQNDSASTTKALQAIQNRLEKTESEYSTKVTALEATLSERNKQFESDKSAAAKALLAAQKELQQLRSNSSDDDKLRELQNQILELMDTVEMVTLDKEQLLVDNELLQEKHEKLKAQLALLTTELSESKNVDNKAVVEENTKLREALKRLHDVSSQEKERAMSTSREAESNAKEVLLLRQFKASASSELEQLKRTLSESNADEYEALIEKLSEKNHRLDEQRKQLEVTVRDLESAQELMDELDVSQRAEIDRLLRTNDALQIALLDKDQTVKMLEERLADLRTTFDKAVKGLNLAKDESDALRLKLQVNIEELEESSSKVQTARTVKQELEALLDELRRVRAKENETDLVALQARTQNARLSRAFEPLSLWTQEKELLSREVHALTLARRMSQASTTKMTDLRRLRSVEKDFVLVALALLEGARVCWMSATLVLTSSTNAGLDTSPFQALLSDDDTDKKQSLLSQVLSRNIRESLLQTSLSMIEHWINVSFLLTAIELLVVALPKLRDMAASSSGLCETLALEVSANLNADKLTGDDALTISIASSLCLVFEKLSLSLKVEPSESDVEASLKECLATLRGIAPRASSTTSTSVSSILDGDLLLIWATDPSCTLGCEWVARADKLHKLASLQEQEYRKYHETAEAFKSMQMQYEMREEEAKAATARAEELRKMLESYEGSSQKGDVLKDKKFQEEIKTLTDALEVMEARYENAEKELKKRGKLSGSGSSVGSSPTQQESFSTQSDLSSYWRRLALQRLVSTLNTLSPAPQLIGSSDTIASYRSARKLRAAVRVSSVV